jgi:hypothetical protein
MPPSVRIGSDEHKALFCRSFIDTHDPFRPADIVWPDLDADSLARLKSLPVWNEAIKTESATALRVQTLGRTEKDPLLAEAIALQGYEEGRHAEVIKGLTEHYGIPVQPFPEPVAPKDPVWAFLRTGYGECLDSFFAFGLFALGRKSELFPAKLIDIFDNVMQEEARHILFIVNWAAYLRASEPWILRPAFDARRAWNIVATAVDRARGAMQMGTSDADTQNSFTLKSHSSFGDFTLRSFLELCLLENERRLAPYDGRLLRPALVPPLARIAVKVLPKKPTSPPLSPADASPV